MNKIINKVLLAADKFISEMHLRQSRFTYKACGLLLKTKNEYKSFKKQEIHNIFINMIWLMETLKIYLEGQLR